MAKKESPAKKLRPRSIRFAPEQDTMVRVKFYTTTKKTIVVMGFVLNESRTGFAGLFHTDFQIKELMGCVCKVGQLPDTAAAVRWVKVLDENIIKVGFEYSL